MKVPLSWVREFVDVPDDAAAVGAVLESLGFELEALETITPTFQGIVVGRVTEIAPHPDAERIRLTKVDTGSGDLHEIVCGAWNFEEGALVAVALPGATLSDGEFEIGRRQIRGVVSNGMICSEKELGLGEDHTGILVLTEAVELGTDFVDLVELPETVYDFSVNPNRPDAMSVIGLARELAAYYRVPLREPDVTVSEVGAPSPITVDIVDPHGCPRFTARLVRGVERGPSPLWLRQRLRHAGVRPISNIVDATNYAMLELGHPTHGFDADRLGDTVVVRRATTGETLTTLDEIHRTLTETDIVVADAARAVALAGIMGGADTEVADDTRNVLVEAAYWDPPSILQTSKRLGLRSEASARFERGMDPNFTAVAADRVAQLLVAHAGGAAAPDPADPYPEPVEPLSVTFPLTEVPRILGEELPRDTVVDYLIRLGFAVDGSDPLTVEVPTRRPDVTMPADLIEEIARLHGYDNFPATVATGPGGGMPRELRRQRLVAETMVGAGYHETMSLSFLGEADLDHMLLPADDLRRRLVRVANPLREEEAFLQTTLLPGLLAAASRNLGRQSDRVALFEVAKVFFTGEGKLPDQPDHLGFVATGAVGGGWFGPARAVDAGDALGTWATLAAALGAEYRLESAEPAGFHPGRAAFIIVGGDRIGVVGEIHPLVARSFGVDRRVAAGEVDLSVLVGTTGDWQFRVPSPFPPVIFDLAFEMDESVPAANVTDAVTRAAGGLLERLDIFDVFSGDPLPPGRKSLAVRLMLRAPDRTMTDEEVAPVRRQIVAAVADQTGASLRGG